jgi:hypothetical protein
VKNRDCPFFDNEENPIAQYNQFPYFDAEASLSGASGQLSGSEVKRNPMARCSSRANAFASLSPHTVAEKGRH